MREGREGPQARYGCASTRSLWLLGVLLILTLMQLHGSVFTNLSRVDIPLEGNKGPLPVVNGSPPQPVILQGNEVQMQQSQPSNSLMAQNTGKHPFITSTPTGQLRGQHSSSGIQAGAQQASQAKAGDATAAKEQVVGFLAKLKEKGVMASSNQPSTSQPFDTVGRERVTQYIASADFQARRAQLQQLQGRGIVMTAGGLARLGGAYMSLRILREVLNSSMLVELMYSGAKEYHDVLMSRIEALGGIKLVDVSKLPVPAHLRNAQELTGWYVKAMSLYGASSFREVLLLDADNTLLIPPEQLFDAPQWRQHGNAFWPDYTMGGEPGMKPTRSAFTKLGLPVPWDQPTGPHFRTVESGQVLLDRARHADVLEWLWYLNSHHAEFDKELHGDKDTFEMAFMLANKTREYQQIRVPAGQALGYEKSTNTYHHRGMTQYTADGRLAFHHRTSGGKLLNHCRDCNVTESTCRVVYVTSPLTVRQALVCGEKGWVWKANDLELDAWTSLNCSYTSHLTALAASGLTSMGEQTSRQIWPGVHCTKSTDKVAVLPVSMLGPAADVMSTAFEFFLQLGPNLTASDWY